MSTINAANITDGTTSVPTGYVVNGSAKAWANTPSDGEAVNESFNISSLTDVATGVQRFTLSNSMSSSNYTAVFTPRGNINQCWTGTITSTMWETANYTGSAYGDVGIVTIAHGDLA
jgi:hypothetical protein